MTFDGDVLLFIQDNIRCEVLDLVFKGITMLGELGTLWIVVGIILIIPKKTRKTGFTVLVALLMSLIINNGIIKHIVGRARPYDMVTGLETVIGELKDSSFPSGHTASSFAAAMVIFRNMSKKFGVPAIILAVLIGISRMYLGVHYPTDVIFGAISGIIIALTCDYIIKSTGHKSIR